MLLFCSLTERVSEKRSSAVFCNEDVRLDLERFFVNLKNYNLSEVTFSPFVPAVN